MRGKIWRNESALRDERAKRKFGTLGNRIVDGCFPGAMVRDNLTRGPTH